ncbi:MAG: rRNA pseudouridine synthase [Christensenellaceae bacterium]|jgi:23S rRNA pseudouridine2605 synthase|nr:rRNA pseudouridine synthase [Christensenellaceae bacterium]
MRINKYLASCGIASRRSAEKLITDGFVKINNVVITNLSTDIKDTDLVLVKDKKIYPVQNKIYIILNKPVGVLSTCFDPQKRKTILDIVKVKQRIFPVGRLDYDTSGLLILTNDGAFANKMTHPKNQTKKIYIATTDKPLTLAQLQLLSNGVLIDGYKTAPAEFKEIAGQKIQITIHEGKNRQIRKMFETIDVKVKTLQRIQEDNIKLGSLPIGKWKFFTPQSFT